MQHTVKSKMQCALTNFIKFQHYKTTTCLNPEHSPPHRSPIQFYCS